MMSGTLFERSCAAVVCLGMLRMPPGAPGRRQRYVRSELAIQSCYSELLFRAHMLLLRRGQERDAYYLVWRGLP